MPTKTNRRSLINSIDTEYLPCRAMQQHAWKYHRVESHDRRTWAQSFVCMRCSVIRTIYVHKDTGRLVKKAHYDYPAGYKVEGLGRLSAEDNGLLRLRLMVEVEPE